MVELNDFTDYLEGLCTVHKEIKHSDSETHFVNMNEEVVSGNDSHLYYPCVMLEKDVFTYTTVDGKIMKKTNFIILILDHVSDSRDYDCILSTIRKCETILDDLFKRMLEDKKERKFKFLLGFDLDGTQAENIENKNQSLYGVAATFNISLPFRAKVCNDSFLDSVFDISFDKTFD